MPARCSAFLLLLAALVLAGCGKVEDDLASPDAMSWCDEPLGGDAARVSVTRRREDDGIVTTTVAKLDLHGNGIAYFEDANGDGTIDDMSMYEWEYDEEGRWLERRRDDGGDGTLDRVISREFDDSGRVVFEATDENGDGAWDVIQTETYDEEDRIVSISRDHAGNIEASTIMTYVYDESGGYIQTRDDGLDGTPDMISYTSFEDGVWLDQTDFDADGDIDAVHREVYDAEGRIIEAADDFEGDGVFDAVIAYTYAPDGQLDTELFDVDGDGDVDAIATYTRDTEGNLLSIETRSPGGGYLQNSTVYTYDGDVVTEVRTNHRGDGDGVYWTCTETFDAEGPLSEGCDNDGDGQREYLATYVDCP